MDINLLPLHIKWKGPYGQTPCYPATSLCNLYYRFILISKKKESLYTMMESVELLLRGGPCGAS